MSTTRSFSRSRRNNARGTPSVFISCEVKSFYRYDLPVIFDAAGGLTRVIFSLQISHEFTCSWAMSRRCDKS